MAASYDLALCVARFPLPHRAAMAAIERTLQLAPRCVIALRDAHMPRSPRNPFRWDERAEMIADALAPSQRDRVAFAPMRELYDEDRTAGELRALAAHLDAPARKVIVSWAGEPDERLGEALIATSHWHVQPAHEIAQDEQNAVARLFEPATAQEAVARVAHLVPVPQLARWLARAGYDRLRAEWRQIAHEKEQWSVAPYPVVLVTVDAIVRASDHVLLIRRGRLPGQGLRALPGGFVGTDETVCTAAVRELLEETGLRIGEREARKLLRGVQVFDHPRRSQRGRVVTHAHYFDLGEGALPAVKGADDAAAAEWVPIARLAQMEAEFLDDHFHILDHFLHCLDHG